MNAFIMATDGVLDAFVRDSREANRIYYPFIEPALTQNGTDLASVQKIQQFYYQYMAGEEYRSAVTDDLTLIAVTNLSRISDNRLPVFDKDEWDRKTIEYQEELDAALYAGRITAPPEPDQESTPKEQELPEKQSQPASPTAPANQIEVPEFVMTDILPPQERSRKIVCRLQTSPYLSLTERQSLRTRACTIYWRSALNVGYYCLLNIFFRF